MTNQNRVNTVYPDGFFDRYAAQAPATTKLSAEDKLDITEVVYGLETASDAQLFDKMAELLTDDLTFDHPFARREGKQPYIDFWRQSKKEKLDGLRHQLFNITITGNPDGTATAIGYLMILKFADESDERAASLPTIAAHGMLNERLRKENGVWRIMSIKIDQMSVSSVFPLDAEQRRLFAAPSEERPMTLEEAQQRKSAAG